MKELSRTVEQREVERVARSMSWVVWRRMQLQAEVGAQTGEAEKREMWGEER